MPMGRSKVDVLSDLTIDQDLAMGTHKLTGLGAPADTNDSLRYGVAEIRNEEIAAGAAIAYAKLALTGLIVKGDIKAATGIEESKLALTYGTSALFTKVGTDIGTHSDLITGIHGYAMVRKTADKTLNNVAVLENDDHLLMALGANEVWQIDLFILCQGLAAADIQFGWSYPVNCLIYWGVVGAGGDVNTNTWGLSDVDVTPVLRTQIHNDVLGIAPPASVTGYRLSVIVINGANAGNINLQWAQSAATVGDTTVLENSCLIAHQLA